MRAIRVIQGGVVTQSPGASAEYAIGRGSTPAEFILEIEHIGNTAIYFKDPLPDWVKPGCTLAITN